MTLQQQINKGREEAELAVFWEQMASFLPKSIERAALGDEKIFRAFKAVYPMMKKHIQISLLEAVKESGPEEIAITDLLHEMNFECMAFKRPLKE